MIALVLSSASGPSGNRPARNPTYKDALELLLTRLKGLDAVLEDALVDTRDTRRMGLPEDESRLTSGPLRLSEQPDMRELRKQLTRAQAPIGQRPGARPDGNTTKQIKLRLTVPGYRPSDASILETLLASAIDRFEYQSADETEPEPGRPFLRDRGTRSIRLRISGRSARTATRCCTSGARRTPPRN